jgi:NAD+ synthase
MVFSGEETNLSEREKVVLNIYRTLNKQNQHKMQPIPVCSIPKELK